MLVVAGDTKKIDCWVCELKCLGWYRSHRGSGLVWRPLATVQGVQWRLVVRPGKRKSQRRAALEWRPTTEDLDEGSGWSRATKGCAEGLQPWVAMEAGGGAWSQWVAVAVR